MAKATVDKSVCIGCGVCTAIASAVFAIGADGAKRGQIVGISAVFQMVIFFGFFKSRKRFR